LIDGKGWGLEKRTTGRRQPLNDRISVAIDEDRSGAAGGVIARGLLSFQNDYTCMFAELSSQR
jgi:hypothetical protein